MKTAEIKQKARQLGIKTGKKMTQEDIIRAIQAKEGNFPCFKTATQHCDQKICSWRSACLPNN